MLGRVVYKREREIQTRVVKTLKGTIGIRERGIKAYGLDSLRLDGLIRDYGFGEKKEIWRMGG